MLCEYPEVQQKMADEISEQKQSSEFAVRAADKTRLPFCRAVLLEMFRFTSVVPFVVPRRALCDTEMRGMEVPKEYGVSYHRWFPLSVFSAS